MIALFFIKKCRSFSYFVLFVWIFVWTSSPASRKFSGRFRACETFAAPFAACCGRYCEFAVSLNTLKNSRVRFYESSGSRSLSPRHANIFLIYFFVLLPTLRIFLLFSKILIARSRSFTNAKAEIGIYARLNFYLYGFILLTERS